MGAMTGAIAHQYRAFNFIRIHPYALVHPHALADYPLILFLNLFLIFDFPSTCAREFGAKPAEIP